MINLSIKKIRLVNSPVPNQIQVSLYIKDYYGGSYSLIESDVLIDVDGTVLTSPLPVVSINPAQKYVLKAVNESCGFSYEQNIIFSPYCPTGYQISADGSYCFFEETVSATPPTSPENSIAVNHNDYSAWGSLIYDPGFNINGTGPFTQISYTNPFWVNGAGYPSGAGANTTDGPLNRSGLWATTTADNQIVGFSVCINAPVDGVYYVAVAADNYASIYVDGVLELQMDPAAIGTYLASHGYAGVGVESTFRFWHIYPIMLAKGSRVVEIVGTNVTVVASIGTEVYNATSAELQAAASYGDLGSKLIFSTKDYIGSPIQLGSGGIGYSCPAGYSLKFCDSPPDCVRLVTTPVLFH